MGIYFLLLVLGLGLGLLAVAAIVWLLFYLLINLSVDRSQRDSKERAAAVGALSGIAIIIVFLTLALLGEPERPVREPYDPARPYQQADAFKPLGDWPRPFVPDPPPRPPRQRLEVEPANQDSFPNPNDVPIGEVKINPAPENPVKVSVDLPGPVLPVGSVVLWGRAEGGHPPYVMALAYLNQVTYEVEVREGDKLRVPLVLEPNTNYTLRVEIMDNSGRKGEGTVEFRSGATR